LFHHLATKQPQRTVQLVFRPGGARTDYCVPKYCTCIQLGRDMSTLPDFEPITREELRQFWVKYRVRDVRRLVLEVERHRRVMSEVDSLYAIIHQAWRDEVGGDLIALHRLKQVLYAESQRRF